MMYRYWLIILGLIVGVEFVMVSQAQAAKLECSNYDGMGDGYCIALKKGKVVLQPDNGQDPPRIEIDSKIYNLRMVSSRVLRETKPYSGMVGYKTQDTYAFDKNSIVVATYIVRDTYCYFKDDHGVWQQSESCCSTYGDITIKIKINGKYKLFSGNYQSGG